MAHKKIKQDANARNNLLLLRKEIMRAMRNCFRALLMKSNELEQYRSMTSSNAHLVSPSRPSLGSGARAKTRMFLFSKPPGRCATAACWGLGNRKEARLPPACWRALDAALFFEQVASDMDDRCGWRHRNLRGHCSPTRVFSTYTLGFIQSANGRFSISTSPTPGSDLLPQVWFD